MKKKGERGTLLEVAKKKLKGAEKKGKEKRDRSPGLRRERFGQAEECHHSRGKKSSLGEEGVKGRQIVNGKSKSQERAEERSAEFCPTKKKKRLDEAQSGRETRKGVLVLREALYVARYSTETGNAREKKKRKGETRASGSGLVRPERASDKTVFRSSLTRTVEIKPKKRSSRGKGGTRRSVVPAAYIKKARGHGNHARGDYDKIVRRRTKKNLRSRRTGGGGQENRRGRGNLNARGKWQKHRGLTSVPPSRTRSEAGRSKLELLGRWAVNGKEQASTYSRNI